MAPQASYGEVSNNANLLFNLYPRDWESTTSPREQWQRHQMRGFKLTGERYMTTKVQILDNRVQEIDWRNIDELQAIDLRSYWRNCKRLRYNHNKFTCNFDSLTFVRYCGVRSRQEGAFCTPPSFIITCHRHMSPMSILWTLFIWSRSNNIDGIQHISFP